MSTRTILRVEATKEAEARTGDEAEEGAQDGERKKMTGTKPGDGILSQEAEEEDAGEEEPEEGHQNLL